MSGENEVTPAVVLELDRLKAVNRANIMAKCFNKQWFAKFVDAINVNLEQDEATARPIFDQAASDAGLTQGQQEWLWNYLKNYQPGLAWNMSSSRNGW